MKKVIRPLQLTVKVNWPTCYFRKNCRENLKVMKLMKYSNIILLSVIMSDNSNRVITIRV